MRYEIRIHKYLTELSWIEDGKTNSFYRLHKRFENIEKGIFTDKYDERIYNILKG